MQTKDLRYTSAELTREYQRWCVVQDVPAGASNVLTISFAMQYADTLRCYDISTLEDSAIQSAVHDWLLNGKPIWETLEPLRLPLQELDALRVQIPEGFVGRVLLLRARPVVDADPEAPELIRLGALLHRIQQEPTALNVWKDLVRPIGYKAE